MNDIDELYDLAATCRDRGTVTMQPEQAEALLRVLLLVSSRAVDSVSEDWSPTKCNVTGCGWQTLPEAASLHPYGCPNHRRLDAPRTSEADHCPGCEDPSMYASRGCPGLRSETASPRKPSGAQVDRVIEWLSGFPTKTRQGTGFVLKLAAFVEGEIATAQTETERLKVGDTVALGIGTITECFDNGRFRVVWADGDESTEDEPWRATPTGGEDT